MIRKFRPSRRSFLIGGSGAATIALGYWWLNPDIVIESTSPSDISLHRIARLPTWGHNHIWSVATSLAWSPDGRLLAVVYDNGLRISVFDTISWTAVSRLNCEIGPAQRMVLFTTNSEFVTQPRQSREKWLLEAFDPQTGEVIRQIPRPYADVTLTAYVLTTTASREYLAVLPWNVPRTPLLFEASAKTFLGHLNTPSNSSTNALAGGPNNKLVADATFLGIGAQSEVRKHIYIYDAPSNRIDLVLPGHIPGVGKLAWSPNGRLIASGQTLLQRTDSRTPWIRDPNPIRIWDAMSGALVLSFEGMMDPIRALAWHPSSRIIATLSDVSDVESGRLIRFWSIPAQKLVFEYRASAWEDIRTISFNPVSGQFTWSGMAAVEVFEVRGLV